MKNILFILFSFSLIGCSSLEKQKAVNAKMENYQFAFPAQSVYQKAKQLLKERGIGLSDVSKTEGASNWIQKDEHSNSTNFKTRSRFRVSTKEVKGGKSLLRVFREEQSYLRSRWASVKRTRFTNYEFDVLKSLNPSAVENL